MKKIILATIILIAPLLAKEEAVKQNPFLHKDNFPMGYMLTPNAMPNFMHYYMKQGGMFKIDNLTEAQEKTIDAQFDKSPPRIMKLAREIKKLETELVLAIIDDGKTAKELSSTLDTIADKKKMMTVLKIECLNMFKNTLTPKQFEQLKMLSIESPH